MTSPNPQIEVELRRRLADGTLGAWPLNADGSEPVADAEARLLLASIRDSTASVRALASGQNFIGYAGELEDKAVEAGLYRFSGGKATTSLTSPNASLTLTNLAFMADGVTPNDRDLILTRYMVEVDASADVVVMYDATASGAAMPVTNPNRRLAGPNPGQVRVGSGILTGGNVEPITRRATTSSPVAVGPFEWRITPGKSWTVRFLGPGATNTVWINCGWYSVPAGGVLT